MPSAIDDNLTEEICERLIGGEALSRICADPHMPSKSTVYLRMATDEAFRARITRAREAQQEALIDETLDMADAATPADWQVVKLRIWARQWRAAKLAPKKYGDAVNVRHSDAAQHKADMSVSDAAARVAAILEAARRRQALEGGSSNET